MKATRLAIPDVVLLESTVFDDERGFFFESFNQRKFDEAIEAEKSASIKTTHFLQDNHSRSIKNVIRGLHYQVKQPQGKLIRVVTGAVFDVALDLRRQSPTFGQWVGEILTADNKKQLWIPQGFAHGFAVLSDVADMIYKTTDYWAPDHEHCIAWDDPQLAIQWPLEGDVHLSSKDRQGTPFNNAVVFE